MPSGSFALTNTSTSLPTSNFINHYMQNISCTVVLNRKIIITGIIMLVLVSSFLYLQWGTGTPSQLHCMFNQCSVELEERTGYLTSDPTVLQSSVGLASESDNAQTSFAGNVTEIINPEHELLKYKTTIPVIDETYLSKNVEQWNNALRSELDAQHGIYGDEFYTELGRLLIKNEMQYQMNSLGIKNTNDDFKVYGGMSMISLSPHIGYSAVVNATDGNYYWLQGGTFANQVSYYKTSQLQFPDTDEELSVESLLNKPQSITIIPEDGHKARQEPFTLVIHVDNNKVEFFNNTPEIIRIQDNGSGMIGEENTLDWMGPIILPYQKATMTFENPGLYEWDGRNAPNLDRPLWWESHANGHIVVLSDEISDFSRGDKARIAQNMLYNSDIPIAMIGAGNAEQVLMIGIDRAVINTVPDAEEYYLKRAHQLIPFDVEIVMYG